MYKLRFDGLFRPSLQASQAGFMCFSWLLHRQKQLIAYGYGATARGIDATSNVAEYLGLIDGSQAMTGMGVDYDPVAVYGDANVIMASGSGP